MNITEILFGSGKQTKIFSLVFFKASIFLALLSLLAKALEDPSNLNKVLFFLKQRD